MVEISKFMTETPEIRDLTCAQLLHPWTNSCLRAYGTMLLLCSKGSFEFFTPIFLVSIQLIIYQTVVGWRSVSF